MQSEVIRRLLGEDIMKLISRLMLAVFLLAAGSAVTSAQPFPNPIVKYDNQFPDLGLVHVNLTVVNWNAYAPIYFTPTPQLPPCGLNTSASRTWVFIFNAGNNQQLNAFCAFGAPADLQKIWFAAATKPKAIYVVLWDRRANRRVKSNFVRIP
jgi:hypothetical protein